MMRYWFYLSCAQADWEPSLERFHNDLSLALSYKTRVPENDLGFFGVNKVEAGSQGVESLITALNDSRILIPLLTPAYFLSDICAKEWRIFRLREECAISSAPPQ